MLVVPARSVTGDDMTHGFRNRFVAGAFVLLVAAGWSGGTLWGQLPGVPAAGSTKTEAPTVSLGPVRGAAQRLGQISRDLELREEALARLQASVLGWRDDLGQAESVLEQLRSRLAVVLAAGDGSPADSALVAHLELAIAVNTETVELLQLILESVRRLGDELRDARQLAMRIEETLAGAKAAGDDTAGERGRAFEEVLHFLSESSRARGTLSLLKAKRAGLNEELNEKVRDRRLKYDLPALDESEGTTEVRGEVLRLRDDITRWVAQLKGHRALAREHTQNLTEVQLQKIRLETLAVEEDLSVREASETAVFQSLVVTDDDVQSMAARFATQSERIAADGRTLQRDLKTLRMMAVPENGSQTFTRRRQWEVKVAVLQHRLYVLDLELQLEALKSATVRALASVVRMTAPPGDFLVDYARYLDEERQAAGRNELKARGEAWRREYSRLSLEEPGGEAGELAESIRGHYREILDLYDRMDLQKLEMEWCAEVFRFWQAKYETSQRGPFWYLWRSLVSLLIVAGSFLGSTVLWKVTLRPIKKPQGVSYWKRYLLFVSYLAGTTVVWVGIGLFAISYVWNMDLTLQKVFEVSNAALMMVGEKEITLKSIAGLILVLLATVAFYRVICYMINRHIFEYFTWDDGIRHAILSILKYVILFVGISIGLELIGVGLGALALFAGVIGIGIGFGLQNIASNFISGLIILFERPIKKGDFVDAGGLEGMVDSISARATSVITRDNVTVIVPNSEFIGQKVINLSHGDSRVRLHIPVGVAYGSDPALVERVLLEVGRANPEVLDDPEPGVRFKQFGASSLDFELLVWITQYELKAAIISAINFAIFQAFKEHGIQIPFPQMDVHLDGRG
jgi:small-conductance mechanosensitive channel